MKKKNLHLDPDICKEIAPSIIEYEQTPGTKLTEKKSADFCPQATAKFNPTIVIVSRAHSHRVMIIDHVNTTDPTTCSIPRSTPESAFPIVTESSSASPEDITDVQ